MFVSETEFASETIKKNRCHFMLSTNIDVMHAWRLDGIVDGRRAFRGSLWKTVTLKHPRRVKKNRRQRNNTGLYSWKNYWRSPFLDVLPLTRPGVITWSFTLTTSAILKLILLFDFSLVNYNSYFTPYYRISVECVSGRESVHENSESNSEQRSTFIVDLS